MLDARLPAAPPSGAPTDPGGPDPAAALLEHARQRGRQLGLPFAGSLPPTEAWELVSDGRALLVDVRSAEERKFVGHVPESLHVAWASGTALHRNPRFVKELESTAGRNAVILLLCRSGKRSALAAESATRAGFPNVFNVEEGFEGELDGAQRRGQRGGWRFHGLPWVQD